MDIIIHKNFNFFMSNLALNNNYMYIDIYIMNQIIQCGIIAIVIFLILYFLFGRNMRMEHMFGDGCMCKGHPGIYIWQKGCTTAPCVCRNYYGDICKVDTTNC